MHIEQVTKKKKCKEINYQLYRLQLNISLDSLVNYIYKQDLNNILKNTLKINVPILASKY